MTMGRMIPQPASNPGGEQKVGSLAGRLLLLRVRTLPLVKYLATAVVGLILVLYVTLHSTGDSTNAKDYVKPLIKADQPIKFTPNEMKAEQLRRKRVVEEVCERNGVFPNTSRIKQAVFNHIYVNDKHKFLYCMVPKVACTNFKRMLLILSGRVNTTSPSQLESSAVHSYLERNLKTLNKFPEEGIKMRLRNYYKFVFVRDPLERILSAYINKFTLNYNFYFHKRYGTRIVKAFRKHPSADSLMGGHNVSFQEFVQYLLEPSISEPLNEHWRHYYKLCSPCIVQYDAIGKYETMAQDVDYVLGEIGVRDLFKFPSGKGGNSRGRTSGLLKTYYQNISSDDINRLWQMYSVDYSMFSYPYPNVKGDTK